MTPQQIAAVRESWTRLLPIQDTAAELFYQRLFRVYPEVEPLFKGDMQEQGEKLMKLLGKAVDFLDDTDALIEPLKQAGRAHRSYGVKQEDYEKVADCLFWTLEEGLGKAFDSFTRESWAETYAAVSGIMIQGAGYEKAPDTVNGEKMTWLRRLFGKAMTYRQVS